MPLVYQARNWNHGVFIGSTMSSETTAAATGQVGVVRHDPMAMLPFCGYNIANYFQHWIDMGKKLGDKAPKIFNVNWFRTDSNGNCIWPGFGENMRVLEWILARCDEKVDAQNTQIGELPYAKDLNVDKLDINASTLEQLLSVNIELWRQEVNEIKHFYQKFDDTLPVELAENLMALDEALKKRECSH